ncbi:MAG: hypothetical protein LBT66_03600 [Methanobrevibacter sp.]|jgi:5-methylcytosine-specific restriction enzyme subunit McrC|nr:hypothetical protein [Candidatus Methanovirga meridionalis]
MMEDKEEAINNPNFQKHIHKIPISNIYYMLSYALDFLEIDEDFKIEYKDFRYTIDLYAHFLLKEVNVLLKRGFLKGYEAMSESTAHIKGKININKSIKRQSLRNKKLYCEYDEFVEDILFNRVIKSTIISLTKIKELNIKKKEDLQRIIPYFNLVSNININNHDFDYSSWNRNNYHYKWIIELCKWIFRNYILPDDRENEDGVAKTFTEKHKNEIAKLFEKFVFKFYEREFKDLGELKGFKVHNQRIKWDLNLNYDEERGKEYLPTMVTDIILEHENKQLIIDTKFYKNILDTNYKKKTLKSSHLYQIYSYINNSKFNGEISGMLLYASFDEDINYQYKIQDKIIHIKSLNLNQEWEKIDEDLREIVKCITF